MHDDFTSMTDFITSYVNTQGTDNLPVATVNIKTIQHTLSKYRALAKDTINDLMYSFDALLMKSQKQNLEMGNINEALKKFYNEFKKDNIDLKKELEEFVRRFSANASKSKQATSRKKLLDKITIDEIQASTRRYPHINFKAEREIGDQLLEVDSLTYQTPEGNVLLNNISFSVNPNDKVVVVGSDPLAISALFKVLAGELEPTKGTYKWGVTTSQAYLPNDNNSYFTIDLNLVDWLRQYSKEKDESFIRGFLGRMLFSGEEALKKCNVLSGGEKVRCMLSRMMLQGANVLLMDEPTNHLDLEAITALNNGMVEAKGTIFFASHDLQIVNTVATHVIELFPKGCLSKKMTYEEYLSSDLVKQQRAELLK